MAAGEPAIGIAAFAVDHTGRRTLVLQAAARVRAASLSKPLLAWVAGTQAPFSKDTAAWEVLSRAAVTVSDNNALAELWWRGGEGRLLVALNNRVGVDWCIDGDGEHPALRIMLTAEELARAYAELSADGTHAAHQVRGWMRDVAPEQTFGLRSVACDGLGVEENAIGVKCGCFGGERAHAALVVNIQGRTVGAAITTSRLPDARTRAAVEAVIGNDTKLAAAHDEAAGEDIRNAARRALIAAREL